MEVSQLVTLTESGVAPAAITPVPSILPGAEAKSSNGAAFGHLLAATQQQTASPLGELLPGDVPAVLPTIAVEKTQSDPRAVPESGHGLPVRGQELAALLKRSGDPQIPRLDRPELDLPEIARPEEPLPAPGNEHKQDPSMPLPPLAHADAILGNNTRPVVQADKAMNALMKGVDNSRSEVAWAALERAADNGSPGVSTQLQLAQQAAPVTNPAKMAVESPASIPADSLKTAPQPSPSALNEKLQEATEVDFTPKRAELAMRPEPLPQVLTSAGVSSPPLLGATSTIQSQPPAIPPHLVEAGVADSLGEKIVWMTGKGLNTATLHLNPAELGSVEIRVAVNNATAHVEIHAKQAETGDMLETMLPKLQAALEQQGLKLEDVKFSSTPLLSEGGQAKSQQGQDSPSQQANGSRNKFGGEADSTSDPSGPDERSALTSHLDQPGSIDFYA